jgi:hypothetical protein
VTKAAYFAAGLLTRVYVPSHYTRCMYSRLESKQSTYSEAKPTSLPLYSGCTYSLVANLKYSEAYNTNVLAVVRSTNFMVAVHFIRDHTSLHAIDH